MKVSLADKVRFLRLSEKQIFAFPLFIFADVKVSETKRISFVIRNPLCDSCFLALFWVIRIGEKKWPLTRKNADHLLVVNLKYNIKSNGNLVHSKFQEEKCS